jgi:hypothetical protein
LKKYRTEKKRRRGTKWKLRKKWMSAVLDVFGMRGG